MLISSPPAQAPLKPDYRPTCGVHIYVVRAAYSHHGIDCGDGTAVDFGASGGGKSSAEIRRVTLAEFSQGLPIRHRQYGSCFPPEIVVARANSMIGPSGYDLFANNCEHFATWCMVGEHSSAQVDAVWSRTSMMGAVRLAPEVGTRVVVGLGRAAPRSGPNLMSGLTRLGGSAVGGVALIAGAGAVVGTGTVMFGLRDKPYLTEEDRNARRVGRVAGVSGAAIGAGVAVHAVGALGVAGYSAAGLSSGLATLGSVVGGGMAAGVGVVAAIPLLLAITLALLGHALKECLGQSGALRSATA